MNNVKMKYDGKIAVMSEEIASLKLQASKYRRERKLVELMRSCMYLAQRLRKLRRNMNNFRTCSPVNNKTCLTFRANKEEWDKEFFNLN